MDRNDFISDLQRDWAASPRWRGITRPYSAADVWKLRGSLPIEYTLARHGAARLWKLLHEEAYVPALSAVTGNQAIQEVRAGLKAVYVSGWQVAGGLHGVAAVGNRTHPVCFPRNSCSEGLVQ